MPIGERYYGEDTYGEGSLLFDPIEAQDPDSPITLIEWSPTTKPLAAASWVAIEQYVSGYKTSRGRDRDLDAYETGTATLKFENHDRRFDPNNSASPYFPNVRTLKRMRIRELWADTYYPIFDGFVEDWDFENGYPQANEAIVKLSDAFIIFAALPLNFTSVWHHEVTQDAPVAFWRLGEQTGNVAADSVGNNHGRYHGNVERTSAVVPYESDGAAGFRDGNGRVELPPVYISGTAYTIECWVRVDGQDNEYATAWSTKPDQNGVSNRLWIDGNKITLTSLWLNPGTGAASVANAFTGDLEQGTEHHVVARFSSAGGLASFSLYVDGEHIGTASTGGPAFTPGYVSITLGRSSGTIVDEFLEPLSVQSHFNGAVDDVTLYDFALSAARITAHYDAGHAPWDGDTSGERLNRLLDLAGVPASWRDIDTGIATLGPQSLGGTLLEHMKACEKAEQGQMFMTADNKVRFVNRYARITPPFSPAATYSTTGTGFALGPEIEEDRGYDLIRNSIKGSREGGPEFTVEDQDSQDDYGLREDTDLTGLPFRNDNDVRGLMGLRLRLYKDETVRFHGLVLTGIGEESTYYPEMLGRDIGDLIEVEHKQAGVSGSPYTGEQYIERVEHEASDGVKRQVTFATSPAPPRDFLILDDPVYGLPNGSFYPAA